MSKSPRLYAQATDGPLAYEFTIHRAAAKESAESSHAFIEFLQSIVSNADIGFWQKFPDEASPEMYFSAVLKSLAQAWACQYWDPEDIGSDSMSLHRAIDQMLVHLNKTGYLPEEIESPWKRDDSDSEDDSDDSDDDIDDSDDSNDDEGYDGSDAVSRKN